MHPDWCFCIAVYGEVQPSGINTYWERVLCIVTDTLVPDPGPGCKGRKKSPEDKLICLPKAADNFLLHHPMYIIRPNQLPHVTILHSAVVDWERKTSPTEAKYWCRWRQTKIASLFSSLQGLTIVCFEDVFFHEQLCWQCADGEGSQVSLASPNKVRGEAIYYFGGEPSWRNL